MDVKKLLCLLLSSCNSIYLNNSYFVQAIDKSYHYSCNLNDLLQYGENMKTNSEPYIPALRFNWLTHFYDPIIAATTREKIFKKQLIKQANIQNGHKVIDIGSGTGTLALWIKQSEPEAQVIGLDGDSKILAIAQKKSQTQEIDVTFEQGLSFDMPFCNNQFDRCMSSLFFHHLTLENKERTFKEMYRILKSGSEIHIADWGKPHNTFMRFLFYQIQLLDGFKTTTTNMLGVLPVLMKKVGFDKVITMAEIPTMFGTMTLYKATKP